MRILVVASGVPYPPTWGSGMRTFQLVRHLARRHAVTLLCSMEPWEAEKASSLQSAAPELRVEAVSRGPATRYGRRLGQLSSLGSRRSFALRGANSPTLQHAVDKMLQRHQHDIVQLEGSQLSPVRLPSGIPWVINEHNIEYQVLDQMRRGEDSVLRRSFNAVEYVKVRSSERQAWRQAHGCSVPSDREVGIVREHAPSTPVIAVPNAVDLEHFRSVSGQAVPGSLLFTGLLSYRPNLDAARYLVHEILPRVKRDHPGASLTIVGDGEPAELESLRRPGVRVTGRVGDLRPFLTKAAVCVAPIRIGGGTRLKVLEALAMGKGLVCTPLGCEGLDLRDGVHLAVAPEDAASFASRVVELLDAPATASMLGAQGQDFVKVHYTWAASSARLEGLLDAVYQGPSHSGAPGPDGAPTPAARATAMFRRSGPSG